MGSDAHLTKLLVDPRVTEVRTLIRESDDETLADQISLTEVPAPPFSEEARARHMRTLMSEAGLRAVHVDATGNVLGTLPGATDEAPLVLAAHLDTVFPAGTDVTVHRRGEDLYAPGISDDGRGLAVILAVTRALVRSGVRLERPVLVVGTVGEEGLGNLRGVRHLFGPDGVARNAAGFISVDGAGLDRIVVQGLGSRRFRVRVTGDGGHSWVNRGVANPIHALGRLVAHLAAREPLANPESALTVARWSGGTSINSIPQQAWVELDTRSESEAHLGELERVIRAAAQEAVDEEAGTASGGELSLSVESVGARPGGATPETARLVRSAALATTHTGGRPRMALSSTDANLPMSLGVPALTFGGGGVAGGAHTLEEWYRNEGGPEGVFRALLTVVLAAGLAGG